MGSVKKNIIYNISYQILILIVPFITSPYVSRVLGPEGLGTYSVTTAIVKYFTLFALLGMSNYGNRTIAKNKDSKEKLSVTFWNLYYFQLISSSTVLMMYIIYLLVVGIDNYGLVSLCQIPYMLSCVFEIGWFFYGMENFKGIVTRNTVVKILTTIAVFAFVKERGDAWIYVLINSLSLLMGQLCLWPFVFKYVSWKKPNWSIIRSHFKPNCILMISVIAVSVYTLMDKIMIEWMTTTTEVGYYENTEKIVAIANNAAGAVGAVMLPRVSNLRASGSDDKVLSYISKSMKYIMLIAVALAFGIAGVSKSFSVIYYGKEFERCGTLLMMISPAIVFYAASNILRNQYLLPKDMDRVFVTATVSASILNFVLNSIFIPVYGALGAVIGTVGAQFGELAYQALKTRKELPIKKYILYVFPYICFGAIMFFACKRIEKIEGISVVSLITQIIVGGIIFLILVSIYFIITRDELFSSIINKIKKKV